MNKTGLFILIIYAIIIYYKNFFTKVSTEFELFDKSFKNNHCYKKIHRFKIENTCEK